MRKPALLASTVLISLATVTPAKAQPNIPDPCRRYVKTALEVGFRRGELPELFRLAMRESRCIPHNKGLNKRADGSVWSTDLGLLQINNYSWVTYLRGLGIIDQQDDLLNARINLRAALALVKYSIGKGHPKWHQWRTGNPNGSAGTAARGSSSTSARVDHQGISAKKDSTETFR
jgi:hypothetical protein